MHEYCKRCEADLTMQKGFDRNLPYWICRGCGEMLTNPDNTDISDIVWLCDGCEALLNEQEGFDESCGEWRCIECGYVNKIDASEVYQTEEEYQATKNSPYRGMEEDDVLDIMGYEEIRNIDDRRDVFLVRSFDDGKMYVKKVLSIYDKSLYEYLKEHPVKNMPTIIGLYEGMNHLVVIEEYIEGVTLSELLVNRKLENDMALYITEQLCNILVKLHSVEPPIVHRDIKPANIMITKDWKLVLLDINVAKWVKKGQIEDTRLLGTLHYAAPEQFGYGMSASNEKSDIYAVGILLNVMITGKMPKEEKAPDELWPIIERCISLEPEKRYTANELLKEINKLQRV